jgi:hypothetical protein
MLADVVGKPPLGQILPAIEHLDHLELVAVVIVIATVRPS